MGSDATEDQDISHAQYLDLVYSQSETLYDLIPQALRPSTEPTKTPIKTHVDGIVGSIQPSLVVKISKQPNAYATTPSNPKVFAEVNAIQSTQTPGNNKKER